MPKKQVCFTRHCTFSACFMGAALTEDAKNHSHLSLELPVDSLLRLSAWRWAALEHLGYHSNQLTAQHPLIFNIYRVFIKQIHCLSPQNRQMLKLKLSTRLFCTLLTLGFLVFWVKSPTSTSIFQNVISHEFLDFVVQQPPESLHQK